MQIHFAPIQGYTDTIYLDTFARHYGPVDRCYPPFIRIEKGRPRHQDIARLASIATPIPNLTPQIIFRDADEFRTLSDAVKNHGYKAIDLNLGCPYPMQTRKGRGAAMIANADTMAQVCALIAADTDASYSVKMRLGLESPGQWRSLMPTINATPLSHVTLHPRTAAQMYDGEIHADEAAEFIAACSHPVVYNGDLRSPSDIDAILNRHPRLHGAMIGRGLLARPSLAEEWRQQAQWPREERLRRHIDFYASLLQAYSERLCGEAQILQKMKPLWQCLEPEIGRKAAKAIAKATTLAKYEKAVGEISLRGDDI